MPLIEVRPLFLEERVVDSPRRGPEFNLVRALLILLLPDGDEHYTPKEIVEYHFQNEPDRSRINKYADALRKVAERRQKQDKDLENEDGVTATIWSKSQWLHIIPPEAQNKLIPLDQAIQKALDESPRGTTVFLDTDSFELKMVPPEKPLEPKPENSQRPLQVADKPQPLDDSEPVMGVIPQETETMEPAIVSSESIMEASPSQSNAETQTEVVHIDRNEPLLSSIGQAPKEKKRFGLNHYLFELCAIIFFMLLPPSIAPKSKDISRQSMNDYLKVYGLGDKLQPYPPKGTGHLTAHWQSVLESQDADKEPDDLDSFL